MKQQLLYSDNIKPVMPTYPLTRDMIDAGISQSTHRLASINEYLISLYVPVIYTVKYINSDEVRYTLHEPLPPRECMLKIVLFTKSSTVKPEYIVCFEYIGLLTQDKRNKLPFQCHGNEHLCFGGDDGIAVHNTAFKNHGLMGLVKSIMHQQETFNLNSPLRYRGPAGRIPTMYPKWAARVFRKGWGSPSMAFFLNNKYVNPVPSIPWNV